MTTVAWQGLYSDQLGTDYAFKVGKVGGSLRKRVSRLFHTRSLAVMKELMLTLNGAASGEEAGTNYTRVKHLQGLTNELGGKRAIETITLLNRVTTAADESDIDAMLTLNYQPSPYPADLSGNGGGGKLGY
jgi:hypothetical protein